MKKLLLAAAIAGSALTFNALAEGDSLSANVSVTTNYVWRGMTQTDNGAALQGGVDYAHASGAYAGVWASNIYDAAEDGQAFEIDLYVGYAGEAGDFGYDVGLIHYETTIDGADSVQEVYVGGSYKNYGIKYYKGITSDENDKTSYIELSADFEGVADLFNLSLHYGMADYDGIDATDFAVTASKDNFAFAPGHEFGLTLSKFSEDYGDGEDDVKAFVYWAKSFDF